MNRISFLLFLPLGIFFLGFLPSHAPSNYDLELIDLKIVDLQVLSMNDTPGYYFDDADLVKITINVTNNGLSYFVASDKMFKILVMEQDFIKTTLNNEVLEIVDNYYTSYDDELEVRYDNFQSRELFEECDYTNDRILLGHSKVFTICYDILRIWNNEILNIDGQKKYYLVMMDNQKGTSCPNCKKILLSTPKPIHKYQTPSWIQTLFEWNKQGIISDLEYQNSIKYLVAIGIITENNVPEQIQSPSALAEKNAQLKKHQTKLSLAQQTNLYVSQMRSYESQYSDEFSGVVCIKQNNIVTLSGDYTNDGVYYDVVFFKLLLFDGFGNVVSTGLSKIVDVAGKDYRHFSVSTPYLGEIYNCLIMVDSKFPQDAEADHQKTILKLHDITHPTFNGGQPIVFVGKLTDEFNNPIAKAQILIKNEGPCPENHIIGNGETDKKGRFWILTIAKIWDESDNIISVHAEFAGNENYYSSSSYTQPLVVYPSHGEKCVI